MLSIRISRKYGGRLHNPNAQLHLSVLVDFESRYCELVNPLLRLKLAY